MKEEKPPIVNEQCVAYNSQCELCDAGYVGYTRRHLHNRVQGFIRTLKEQYPVTAHAPNFDFWTGCREIKRCEESKRILKNPFASRLAGFNTTLKLLRIIDQ